MVIACSLFHVHCYTASTVRGRIRLLDSSYILSTWHRTLAPVLTLSICLFIEVINEQTIYLGWVFLDPFPQWFHVFYHTVYNSLIFCLPTKGKLWRPRFITWWYFSSAWHLLYVHCMNEDVNEWMNTWTNE